VGGLLFSLESTTTSYLLSAYDMGFASAVIGSVLGYLYTQDSALFVPMELAANAFQKVELLFFFLMGIVGGLLGSLFVVIYQHMYHRHRRVRMWTGGGRWPSFPKLYTLILYPVILALATGLSAFPLGDITRLPLRNAMIVLFSNTSLTDGAVNYTLNGNEYNTVSFNALGPYGTLGIYGVIVFFLTIFSTLLALPVGIFLPVATVGASLGRLAGEGLALALPELHITPSVYAVVGWAALAGGVTRSISTAVIVFEATGSLAAAVPITVAVVTASVIGNYLSPSIYDAMLECLSLPYLPRAVPADKLMETAATLMLSLEPHDGRDDDSGGTRSLDTPPVVQRHTTLSQLFEVLQSEPPGFSEDIAVVESFEHHILIGTVRRKTLRRACVDHHHAILFKTLASAEEDDKSALQRHTTNPDHYNHRHHEHVEATERVHGFAEFISRTHNVSMGAGRAHQEGIMDAPVDLFQLPGLALNPSPLQVEVHTPVSELVHMLSLMHRRYAFVVEFGRLSGVVTFSYIVKALHETKHVHRRNADWVVRTANRRDSILRRRKATASTADKDTAAEQPTLTHAEREKVRDIAQLWNMKTRTVSETGGTAWPAPAKQKRRPASTVWGAAAAADNGLLRPPVPSGPESSSTAGTAPNVSQGDVHRTAIISAPQTAGAGGDILAETAAAPGVPYPS